MKIRVYYVASCIISDSAQVHGVSLGCSQDEEGFNQQLNPLERKVSEFETKNRIWMVDLVVFVIIVFEGSPQTVCI